MTALSLKDLKGAADRFLPVPPAFPPFNPQSVYDTGDFLQLLHTAGTNKLAQTKAQSSVGQPTHRTAIRAGHSGTIPARPARGLHVRVARQHSSLALFGLILREREFFLKRIDRRDGFQAKTGITPALRLRRTQECLLHRPAPARSRSLDSHVNIVHQKRLIRDKVGVEVGHDQIVAHGRATLLDVVDR